MADRSIGAKQALVERPVQLHSGFLHQWKMHLVLKVVSAAPKGMEAEQGREVEDCDDQAQDYARAHLVQLPSNPLHHLGRPDKICFQCPLISPGLGCHLLYHQVILRSLESVGSLSSPLHNSSS